MHPGNLFSSSSLYADIILPYDVDSISFGFFAEKFSRGPFLNTALKIDACKIDVFQFEYMFSLAAKKSFASKGILINLGPVLQAQSCKPCATLRGTL